MADLYCKWVGKVNEERGKEVHGGRVSFKDPQTLQNKPTAFINTTE